MIVSSFIFQTGYNIEIFCGNPGKSMDIVYENANRRKQDINNQTTHLR